MTKENVTAKGLSILATNDNCLEGMMCPTCKSEGPFLIQSKIMVEVSDSGTEDAGGDYEWSDEGICQCQNCLIVGTVEDFTILKTQKNKDYTVLLLYPYGGPGENPETYFDHVRAKDHIEAVRTAQDNAVKANSAEEFDHEDFYPLLVMKGHHDGEFVNKVG